MEVTCLFSVPHVLFFLMKGYGYFVSHRFDSYFIKYNRFQTGMGPGATYRYMCRR